MASLSLGMRLPLYHCDMNPTELVWAAVKHYIRERNKNSELSLKTLLKLSKEAVEIVKKETGIITASMSKELK